MMLVIVFECETFREKEKKLTSHPKTVMESIVLTFMITRFVAHFVQDTLKLRNF